MTVALVPEIETLESLAGEARAAAVKAKASTTQWFEDQMALGRVLDRGRQLESSDQAFGAWRSSLDLGFKGSWLNVLQRAARAEALGLPVASALATDTPYKRIEAMAKLAPNTRQPKKLNKGPGDTPHPAKFSDPIIKAIAEHLPDEGVVLDPFAGTGRIHEVATDKRKTIGVEIEPEWAALHPDTIVGDSLDLFGTTDIQPESVDAIATSPTYGNRLADSHNASDPESRRSYTHDLGRPLHEHNSGRLQWGDEYRQFHRDAYVEHVAALKPGGTYILNISDHIRDGKMQHGVTHWHINQLGLLGLEWVSTTTVETKRLKQGANADARTPYEYVITFRKGTA